MFKRAMRPSLKTLMLFAGYMGLIFYSVFSGVPILIQAYLGIAIQKRLPMVTSFTDFVQRVSLQSGAVCSLLMSLLSFGSFGEVLLC